MSLPAGRTVSDMRKSKVCFGDSGKLQAQGSSIQNKISLSGRTSFGLTCHAVVEITCAAINRMKTRYRVYQRSFMPSISQTITKDLYFNSVCKSLLIPASLPQSFLAIHFSILNKQLKKTAHYRASARDWHKSLGALEFRPRGRQSELGQHWRHLWTP